MRNDRCHTRLLQHYFRQPHPVRIAALPPWQVTGMLVIPGEHAPAKLGFHGIREWMEFAPWLQGSAEKSGSAGSSLLCLGLSQAQIDEWIPQPHGPIAALVLKILREDFGQTVVLSVSPQVGVIPRKAVGCHPAQSRADNRLVGIENRKLGEEVFGLIPALFRREQSARAKPPSGDRIHKLNQRLMRNAELILGQTFSQCLSRHCTLRRIPAIAAIYEDIGINEGSHDLRKAPRASSHDFRA